MTIDPQPDLTPEELELAERGRQLIFAAVAAERAPLALRERIEAQRASVARPARPWWRSVWAPVAGGLAAVIVAIVLIAGGGSTGTSLPTVAAVAGVSLQAPTNPAPATQASNPELLKEAVDGIAFPEWGDKFNWMPSGVRYDTIHGRKLTTVFYKNPAGVPLGYSIVSGSPLKVPSGATSKIVDTEYTVVHEGGRTIVTWRRNGHTCVISAPTSVPEMKLLALASWDSSAGGAGVPDLH